jgi:hypothetical protein
MLASPLTYLRRLRDDFPGLQYLLIGCLSVLLAASWGGQWGWRPLPQEVVVVDAAVEHPDFFLQRLRRNQRGFVVPPDGTLETVTQHLATFHHLQAIHLITHGAPGELHVGQTRIRTELLTENFPQADAVNVRSLLAQWQTAIVPGGDLLLYGCNIAANSAGKMLLTRLGKLTQADVAASTNATGDTVLRGDWELEEHTGPITAKVVTGSAYGSILGQFRVTSSADTEAVGTLRWAISQANQTREDDLITLTQPSTPIVLTRPLPIIRSNVFLHGQGGSISGQEQFRVLQTQGSHLVIRDMTIRDGWAEGNDGFGNAGGAAGLGGGLLIEDARVTLNHVRFVNNRAAGGHGGDRPPWPAGHPAGHITQENLKLKVNRGALTGINGLSLTSDETLPMPPEGLQISGTREKLSANRGAIAGVNGIGVNGIGSIAFGGGGGFGGFGNAGNGGNGGNAGTAGGNGGNGGDGGNGGVGIFGSFGRWDADGGIGTIAYGGGGGFGGFGNAGNGGNGGNLDASMAQGGHGGNGGNGGFGGGGGGGGYGGQGGYGGSAGSAGSPGVGGYGGGDGDVGYGGGGAGLGGAIFLKSGRLILHKTDFDHNVAIAGSGAHPGVGEGSAIFNLPGMDESSSAIQVISLGGPPTLQHNHVIGEREATPDHVIVGSIVVFGDRD